MRQMFDDKQVKALAKNVVKEVIPEAPKEAGVKDFSNRWHLNLNKFLISDK